MAHQRFPADRPDLAGTAAPGANEQGGEPVTPLPAGDDLVARLIAIWSEVLVSGVVDDNTDFVELGGTWLMAVRIRGRIRADLGRDVDMLNILDHPPPKQPAALLPMAPAWTGAE